MRWTRLSPASATPAATRFSRTRARPAAALHIATREDQYYPPPVTEAYAERLRRYIPDVEFHLLDGGHRVPSAARAIVKEWLRRACGRDPAARGVPR